MTDEELSKLIKWTTIPNKPTGGQTVGVTHVYTIGELEEAGIKIELMQGKSHLKNKTDILNAIKVILKL